MSFENLKTQTEIAGAAVSLNRLVKKTTAGEVIHGAAGTDECLGVSLEAAAAQGDAIPVAHIGAGGKCEIEAGAAITAGADLASDASGRVVAATTGDAVVGFADEAASGAGEYITVSLSKGSIAAP